jgi:hypothetical protein
MRANWDAGISGLVGYSRLAGASTAAPRIGTVGVIARMRGLRGDCPTDDRACGALSVGAWGFGLKSSSAARRAFVIRARS